MDTLPFYRFSLAEADDNDCGQIADRLSRFSCETFNAETLRIDAENIRYGQAMREKLAAVLKAPSSDHAFMKWLCRGIYTEGNLVPGVLERLSPIAEGAMRDALGNAALEQQFEQLEQRRGKLGSREPAISPTPTGAGGQGGSAPSVGEEAKSGQSDEHTEPVGETATFKLRFYVAAKEVLSSAGLAVDEVLWSDSRNYLNVSIENPKRWFVRLYGGKKRMYITTRVPCAEAKVLCPGFEVDPGRPESGKSRVYIEKADELEGLRRLILKSYAIRQAG